MMYLKPFAEVSLRLYLLGAASTQCVPGGHQVKPLPKRAVFLVLTTYGLHHNFVESVTLCPRDSNDILSLFSLLCLLTCIAVL